MSDETDGKAGTATVPPPAGAEDVYSAATTVGDAPAELLAIVRDAELAKSDKKKSEPPKTETKKMSDESEKKTSEAPKPKAEPAKAAGASKKAEAPTKSPEAVPRPRSSEPKTAGKPAAHEPVADTSSPASAIITLFVLIAAALALATR